VREALPEIRSAGADVLAVGTAAGWQASALMAGHGEEPPLGFTCVVDPDHNLYRALGLGRVAWHEWATPRLWRNYLGAFRRGARQGAVTGDIHQKPGVAVIDPDRTVRWVHRAITVGDYPAMDSVLAALRARP
jgi:peroxiredoxin